MLVIALRQQRPDQDAGAGRLLDASIRSHRERLLRVAHDATSEAVAGVDLYRPAHALMWGPRDDATMLLADGVISVMKIVNGHGAPSQEVVFGPVLAPETDTDADQTTASLLALLGDEGTHPLIAIAQVKLAEPFRSIAGAPLRRALAEQVHAMAESEGLSAIVAETWSWPELVVVLLGDEPAKMTDVVQRIESIELGTLIDTGTPTAVALEDALLGALSVQTRYADLTDGRAVPRDLMRRWTHGRWAIPSDDVRAVTERVRRCNAVVSAPSQLGVHVPGFRRWLAAARDDADPLRRICELRFSPPEDEQAVAIDETDVLAELFRTRSQAPGRPLRAWIRWLPKPGHTEGLIDTIRRLGDALGAARAPARIVTGYGTAIGLLVEVPPTRDGCLALFAATSWLRVCPDLRRHVLDITCEVEATPAALERPIVLPPSGAGPTGYQLFEISEALHRSRCEHSALRRRALSRVDALSLLAWIGAFRQAIGLPDAFGAMIDLEETVRSLYDSVIYGHDDDGVGEDQLSLVVRELTDFGQRAFQQRLQLTSALAIIPRISAELPCNADQLVGMVNGLSTALFHTARHLASTGPRDAGSTLVFFGADPAIEMRTVGDVGVFKVSLLQAITPMSLCVLFHELGHWMLRQHWSHRPWRRVLVGFAEALVPHGRDHPSWVHRRQRRVETFLEDVVAHAVWRVIGCANDFPRFRTQFLAGQSMGLRSHADPRSPRVALQSWADVVLHLWCQQWLHDHDDDVVGLVDALVGLGDPTLEPADVTLRDEMTRAARIAAPYWRAELELASRRLGVPPTDERLVDALVTAIGDFWLEPLQRWHDARAAGHDRYTDEAELVWRWLTGAAAHLEGVHEAMWSTSSAYASIGARIRAGARTPAPPWDLLDRDGDPTVFALLWAREILVAVTDAFWSQIGGRLASERVAGNTTPSVAIRRGLDGDVLEADGQLEGLFTDARGGVFVAGRGSRDTYHAVRSAAVEAMLELAARVRSGRIHRHFRRGRAFPRFRPPAGRRATVERPGQKRRRPVDVEVYDISSGGLCVYQPPRAKLRPGEEVAIAAAGGRKLRAQVLDERPPPTKEGRARVGLRILSWDPVQSRRDWLAP